MGAEALISRATQTAYLVVFCVVLVRAIREPRQSNLYAAAFFGIAAAQVAIVWLLIFIDPPEVPRAVEALRYCLLLSLPYPLLRLASQFAGMPPLVLRVAEAVLALWVGAVLLAPIRELSPWVPVGMAACKVASGELSGCAA